MNKFYTYPASVQWAVAFVLIIIALAMMGIWTALTINNVLYYLLIFPFTPILQFCLGPVMRLSGVYKYLSPMLLVYNPSAVNYDLHNGTSFDYLWVMRKVEPGRPFQNVMLAYYVEGLLKIIEELEAGIIKPDLLVTGTSYFFSTATAERLGFRVVPPAAYYKFNLYINYLDLVWMYSMAKGKLTFPNFKKIKAVQIQAGELAQKKAYLTTLQAYLKARIPALQQFPEI